MRTGYRQTNRPTHIHRSTRCFCYVIDIHIYVHICIRIALMVVVVSSGLAMRCFQTNYTFLTHSNKHNKHIIDVTVYYISYHEM